MASRFVERGGSWLLGQLPLMFAAIAVGPWLGELASGPARWIAIALITLGLALISWSRASLGKSFTAFPRPIEGGTQAVCGPYRFVRHPMYCGVVVFLAGWSLLWQSAAAALLTAAVLVLLDLKARREERWLESAYPGYAEYRRRTRKFIPAVY